MMALFQEIPRGHRGPALVRRAPRAHLKPTDDLRGAWPGSCRPTLNELPHRERGQARAFTLSWVAGQQPGSVWPSPCGPPSGESIPFSHTIRTRSCLPVE